MQIATDAYTLSFAPDADGGPIHVLRLLKDYVLQFELINKDETLIARIVEVDYDSDEVLVTPFIDGADEYPADDDTPRVLRLKIGEDFQRVNYC